MHIDVVNSIISFARELEFDIKGLTFSPVKGPEGNIEYLLYLKKGTGINEIEEDAGEKIVSASHNELDK